MMSALLFFFSSRRRHTRLQGDWSSDVCSSDLTPFFKLWWTVMPLVKKTRAPGMVFYVVALVTAMLAGLGVERVLKDGSSRRAMIPVLIVGGIVALLGVTGVFSHIAQTLAAAKGAGVDQP